jgi:hypothetical protein
VARAGPTATAQARAPLALFAGRMRPRKGAQQWSPAGSSEDRGLRWCAHATAQDLSRLVREHWTIEAHHHIRDVTFHEDTAASRTGSGPANLATIRAAVIAAIKDAGYLHVPEGRRDHTVPHQPSDPVHILCPADETGQGRHETMHAPRHNLRHAATPLSHAALPRRTLGSTAPPCPHAG